jgi:exosome complex component RRP40
LEALGTALQFELAVGINGRLWVQAENAQTTILVLNAIQSSERLTDPQVRILVANLIAQTET